MGKVTMRYAYTKDGRLPIGIEPELVGAVFITSEDHTQSIQIHDVEQLNETINLLADSAEILNWSCPHRRAEFDTPTNWLRGIADGKLGDASDQRFAQIVLVTLDIMEQERKHGTPNSIMGIPIDEAIDVLLKHQRGK